MMLGIVRNRLLTFYERRTGLLKLVVGGSAVLLTHILLKIGLVSLQQLPYAAGLDAWLDAQIISRNVLAEELKTSPSSAPLYPMCKANLSSLECINGAVIIACLATLH